MIAPDRQTIYSFRAAVTGGISQLLSEQGLSVILPRDTSTQDRSEFVAVDFTGGHIHPDGVVDPAANFESLTRQGVLTIDIVTRRSVYEDLSGDKYTGLNLIKTRHDEISGIIRDALSERRKLWDNPTYFPFHSIELIQEMDQPGFGYDEDDHTDVTTLSFSLILTIHEDAFPIG